MSEDGTTIVDKLEGDLGNLADAIDTMNCGLVVRDPTGIIIFANERLATWLGCKRADIVGRQSWELAPPELHDIIRDEIKAAEAGDARGRLTVLQRVDSTTFPVLFIPQRFEDHAGRVAGTFAVIIDLGTVQTAKRAGYAGEGVRGTLDRIALELQGLALAVDLPSASLLPFDHPKLDDLSPREREVLSLLASGDRVPSIATQLEISPHTVRNHLKSIYRKLDVATQTELIQFVRDLED